MNKGVFSLLVYVAIAFIYVGCFKAMEHEHKESIGHTCRFDLCPYKGHQSFTGVINSGETAIDTSVAEGTDLWCIDALHFEYHNDSYDQLENRLFN